MLPKPTFTQWHCANQRVFLRADLNVPLEHGTISSDHRLRAIQPTLDYLLNQKAQVIIGSHVGRPNGYDPRFSTQLLMPWFLHKGYTIEFAPTIGDVMYKKVIPGTIILLENLRFFPEEKARSHSFALQLASLAPWYVNDAFGALHREDTSLTLLPEHYAPRHRSIGFLIEKEMAILSALMKKPRQPVCFILGGGKVADKLPLIYSLCSFADTIVLCPALVFTFLKVLGHPVGASLVDTTAIPHIASIMARANDTNTKLIFPLDYQVAQHTKEGALSHVQADQFPADSVGISIGPRTVAHLETIIASAGTVFYNGLMGFDERKDTLDGTMKIIKTMAKSSATTIVAGGDSVAVVDQLAVKGITHCMTGGGSTLAYLSHQTLPGLEPFLKHRTKTDQA